MAKVIFLHLSVILFTGGVCIPACIAGGLQGGVCIPACIAGGIPACLAAGLGGRVCYPSMHCRRYPSMPCSRSRGGVCSIRSMSGRYASYWNAFLLSVATSKFCVPTRESYSRQCVAEPEYWNETSSFCRNDCIVNIELVARRYFSTNGYINFKDSSLPVLQTSLAWLWNMCEHSSKWQCAMAGTLNIWEKW